MVDGHIEDGWKQKPRQTVVVAFFGENGRPLRLCSRQIDTGGQGQNYGKICFLLRQ